MKAVPRRVVVVAAWLTTVCSGVAALLNLMSPSAKNAPCGAATPTSPIRSSHDIELRSRKGRIWGWPGVGSDAVLKCNPSISALARKYFPDRFASP